MKINTNSFGNYNPVAKSTSAKDHLNVQEKASNETLFVSKEEKDFFVNKYPENKTEIMDYHFYQRSGRKSGVSLGSLFDKRG